MATLRDIRRRITSVKNIQQITQAMRMVAAAKLRSAADRSLSARPYADKIEELLNHLSASVDPDFNPMLREREAENIAVVVITADRGLCGAFNTNLIRRATHLIEEEYGSYYESNHLQLYCLGRKGYDHFRKRNYPILGHQINFFNTLDFVHAQEAVRTLTRAYMSGEIDRVETVYAQFRPPVLSDIVVKRFLPVIPETHEENSEIGKATSLVDYLYEPSQEAIVDGLVPKHLNVQMWRYLLDSKASEEGARMVAMENATDNAKELITDLTLLFNRTRQAAITNEIAEIVGGAEALKES